MATRSQELAAMERLRDDFGFTYDDIAAALVTDVSTLHGWRSDPSRRQSTYIVSSRSSAFGRSSTRSLRRKRSDHGSMSRAKHFRAQLPET